MKLYNTLSRKVEGFTPRQKETTIYVCGITPYDTTHLGHAFTYTAADILIRYLEFRGETVRYVQNVTDIDDDILHKAKQVGEDWRTVGNRWTSYFIRDMQVLNVRPPDYFPRATDVIPDIIQIVEEILDAGVAYESGGSVYYSVDAWDEFGKLSHLPRKEMLPIANERGNQPDDPNKRDPLDFVLWQAQSPGEPAWESPWGPGRPGWHIECSTMATKYLGDIIDIHGGGADLCFPHHECEIAQVEPVTGRQPFARYWMHTAMVRHEGEKMSKSLGNLVMIRELLKDYSPDTLRIYMGGHHYRDAWEFSQEDLDWAAALAEKFKDAVQIRSGVQQPLAADAYHTDFVKHMENDLDTPAAFQLLEQMAQDILDGAGENEDVRQAQNEFRKFTAVLGLRLDRSAPEQRVIDGWGNFLSRFTVE